MKICIVTNGAASAEPRAVKQAISLKREWPDATVLLLDAAPDSVDATDPEHLGLHFIERQTRRIPTRLTRPSSWAAAKSTVFAAKVAWRAGRTLHPAIFGIRSLGLTRKLLGIGADVYLSHGIDTLLPSTIAAHAIGSKLGFDSMEYYSDMGDNQTNLEKSAARALQARSLPACSLVLAASEGIADALVKEHNIRPPIPIYNTPEVVSMLPQKGSEFSLYWRNYQIGFGQRGLEDALLALPLVPSEIRLYLQGRPPHDGGRELLKRCKQLGVADRVVVMPPFKSGLAVPEAARHSVGLCLERPGPINHDLTVSNKLFDYMMAGLAVIASDLPSLRRVIDRSQGGRVFAPASPQDLARVIRELYFDKNQLVELASRARQFALTIGNNDNDMAAFTTAFRRLVADETK